MSCWVVPMIAAEYWGIPLEQVMDKIHRHAVPVRHENGFTFVDVLPDVNPGRVLRAEERPATFSVVVAEAEGGSAQGEGDSEWVSRNPIRLHTEGQRRGPMAA